MHSNTIFLKLISGFFKISPRALPTASFTTLLKLSPPPTKYRFLHYCTASNLVGLPLSVLPPSSTLLE